MQPKKRRRTAGQDVFIKIYPRVSSKLHKLWNMQMCPKRCLGFLGCLFWFPWFVCLLARWWFLKYFGNCHPDFAWKWNPIWRSTTRCLWAMPQHHRAVALSTWQLRGAVLVRRVGGNLCEPVQRVHVQLFRGGGAITISSAPGVRGGLHRERTVICFNPWRKLTCECLPKFLITKFR